MKSAFAFAILMTASFALAAQAEMQPNLLLNLHLENNTLDSSSYGQVATAYSAATGGVIAMKFEPSCQIGGCMTFSGQNADADYIATSLSGTGGAAGLRTPATITLWLRPQDLGANFAQLTVYHHSSSTSGISGGVQYNGQAIRINGPGGNNDWTTCFTAPAPDGKFHQLAIVYTPNVTSCYWDGKVQGTASNYVLDLEGTTLNFGYSQTTGNPFEGQMDEIRVFNVALGEQDVWRLYSMEKNPQGPEDTARVFTRTLPQWNKSKEDTKGLKDEKKDNAKIDEGTKNAKDNAKISEGKGPQKNNEKSKSRLAPPEASPTDSALTVAAGTVFLGLITAFMAFIGKIIPL